MSAIVSMYSRLPESTRCGLRLLIFSRGWWNIAAARRERATHYHFHGYNKSEGRGYAIPTETSFAPSFIKISKANALLTNAPSRVNVPQKDVAENPEFCTEVSFVPRQDIRGPTYYP